jgi:transcriptional regulator with XRE-family HTH domain
MALSELGALLKNKREELQLSLEDLEKSTHIRRRYLESLEAGDWEALPPGVYTRGLLKAYARALGLSQNSVLRMYAKERPAEARLPEPQLISQPLVRQPRVSTEMLLAVAGFAIAAVLISWLVVSELSPLLAESQLRITDGRTERPTEPVAPTPASVVAAQTAPGEPPTPRPSRTPRPSPTPTPTDGLVVRVDATGDVWLRVIADGQETYTGFMRDSETRQFEGRQVVAVRTGNAGGTGVTVNGQTLGFLGATGEVKTCEWIVRQPGVIEMAGCALPGTPSPQATIEASGGTAATPGG